MFWAPLRQESLEISLFEKPIPGGPTLVTVRAQRYAPTETIGHLPVGFRILRRDGTIPTIETVNVQRSAPDTNGERTRRLRGSGGDMHGIGGTVCCRWNAKVGSELRAEIRSSLAGLRMEVVVEGPGQWKIGVVV